ncbi:MAG: hypothetical protein R3D70_14250 [Rhizobiaceae bacterium]
MSLKNETAAPMALGNGGIGNPKSVALQDYRTLPEIATETYPVLVIASRFGLPVALAGEVIRMAGIGGRLG